MLTQGSASSGASQAASGGGSSFAGFSGTTGAGSPARSSGASAPQGGGSTTPGAPGAGEGGGEVNHILNNTLAELQRTQAAFGQHQAQFRDLSGAYQQQQEMLERMRRALGGEDPNGPAVDPVDAQIGDAERTLEYYIAQGFEAEKSGNPIPLTIDSAIRSLQHQIQYLKESKDSRAKIAKLEQALALAFDGDTRLDMTAREQLGGSLIAAIDTIYGQGETNLAQKKAMWGAVSNLMTAELTNLKKSHPAQWDRIRRDPGKLQKLATYFVEQTIPPRARELMQIHQVQSQPLTQGDLWQAWEEAKGVQDPRQRNQLMTKIRQDLLAVRFSQGRNAQGASRTTSALYGNAGRRAG